MPRKNPQSRLQTMLDHTERQAIEWAFQQTGSLPKAADLLGISRAYIYKRVDLLDLRHLIQQQQTRKDDLPPEKDLAPETTEEDETAPAEKETDPGEEETASACAPEASPGPP
jgi:hypothetical protein